MTYLVDTSIWVDYLRGEQNRATARLRALLEDSSAEVVVTEPVAMELLAGATNDVMLARLERLVNGLPSLMVEPAFDFHAAAAIFRGCRRAGRTVRNLSDCLIAAVALRNEVELLHKDADYEAIASVTPLRSESLR